MSLKKLTFPVIALFFVAFGSLAAQTDQFGKVDTLYAEVYQIDAKNWAVNVSLVNDEEIMALSIPFVFSSGKTKIMADSTIFKGGVAENFRVKHARVDTTAQCVTIGLINDVGVSVPPIPAGGGRIATIFVSAIGDEDLPSLKVDTTTTPPGNNLQLVKPPSSGIVPALVIKEGPKPKN